jgi:uncharacterized Tic20 family protein
MGLVAPIVIWVTQKDKSDYVNFQALQALAYQISMILFWFLGTGCYMCSFLGTFFLIPGGAMLAEGREEVVEPIMLLTFLIPFAIIMIMFGIFMAFIIYGIIGSIMALQGRDFQYVFIGKRVKRFMEK